MKKVIKWEKWIDPFLSNADEVELGSGVKDEDEDEGYQDSFQKLESKLNGGIKKNYTGPVMVGPMGVIPLSEHNTPSKVYMFWMGHTNFDITESVAETIEQVPGVEALDIFTRYRFRVAVGKGFIDPETDMFGRGVLTAITNAVCKDKVKNKQEKGGVTVNTNIGVVTLTNYLKGKYAFWAIFTSPTGCLDSKGAATKEEVIKVVEANTDMKLVATSWE